MTHKTAKSVARAIEPWRTGLGPSAAVLIGASASVRNVAAALSGSAIDLVGAIVANKSGDNDIYGVPVLGSTLTRQAVARAAKAPHAAIWCEPIQNRRGARTLLERASLLRLAPYIAEREGEGVRLRRMTMADLLGRPSSVAESARMQAAIQGRRVLVTGAGGSIGSELVRQVARLAPERITLLENSEFNLYSIDHELSSVAPRTPRMHALCDVRDADALGRWFAREKPDLVFHVAALKQVPLVEAHPSEGVLTNILGTRNVALACLKAGAHMTLVSTDKAVSPSNIMGATKRVAELYCQAMDRSAAGTGVSRFMIARLGNVLGSAGSVSPLFERQLAAGGPLTVTHPEVARFFITIPQAATFLLEATALALSAQGQRAVAHVLDMGEPLRVVDLARDMIRLEGLRPEVDVGVSFVGLRPGEKISEQLIAEDETIVGEPDARIKAVRSPALDLCTLDTEIDALVRMARAGRDDVVRVMLRDLVSGYEDAPPMRESAAG